MKNSYASYRQDAVPESENNEAGPPSNDRIKAIQARQLQMLKTFISLCEENGLQYFAAGGTLLGAVRHGGFIPWDDDLDIIMPRKDYDRFFEIASMDESKYEIVSIYTDQKWQSLFMKYVDKNTAVITKENIYIKTKLGLWIDIFPLDRSPKLWISRILMRFQEKRLNLCLRYFYLKDFRETESLGPLKKMLIQMIGCFLCTGKSSHDFLVKKDDLYRSYCKRETGYVCNYAGRRIRLPVSVFGSGTTMTFEGIPLAVPKRYDIWLKKLYGPDYSLIPSVEKQVTNHLNDCCIFDLEHSYQIYLDENGNLL